AHAQRSAPRGGEVIYVHHTFKLLPFLLLAAACGGPNEAKHPQGAADVTTPLVAAFHEEAGGDQAKSVDLYLRALDTAARSPDHPASVTVALAALDALV